MRLKKSEIPRGDGAAYLSPREQQVLDIVYRQGRATAGDVLDGLLPEEISNSAVRTHLRILEQKGHLTHVEEEGRYVYLPTRPSQQEGRSALSRVVRTFFGGSVEKTVATLLSEQESRLAPEELDRLQAMIDEARKEGR